MQPGSMSDSETPLKAGDRIDRFLIQELLGRGGMGAVYKAHDPMLERPVAIKTMLASAALTRGSKGRFLREARAVSKLVHPNIVRVHDIVITGDGTPCLVMEYLDGQTLAQYLASQPNHHLPWGEALRLLVPVFEAAATAHDGGIIHRDFKPSNILLAKRDGRVDPVVLDFGIARALQSEGGLDQATTNNFVGTPRYMSPEQARSEKNLGPKVDQFALGVVLYEAIAGLHPMGRDMEALSALDQMVRISYADPIPIRTHAADVPPHVEAVLARMLARAPEDRFSSIRDAMTALTQPGFETPASSRRLPRRRAPMAVAGVVLAGLIVVALGWHLRSNRGPVRQTQTIRHGDSIRKPEPVSAPKPELPPQVPPPAPLTAPAVSSNSRAPGDMGGDTAAGRRNPPVQKRAHSKVVSPVATKPEPGRSVPPPTERPNGTPRIE
jgi:serine/threonine protein kinase